MRQYVIDVRLSDSVPFYITDQNSIFVRPVTTILKCKHLECEFASVLGPEWGCQLGEKLGEGILARNE